MNNKRILESFMKFYNAIKKAYEKVFRLKEEYHVIDNTFHYFIVDGEEYEGVLEITKEEYTILKDYLEDETKR